MSRKLNGTYIESGTITLTQLAGSINDTSNAAYNQANAAYSTANLKLNTAGGTISGDLTVTGNIYLGNGNTSYVNVNTIAVNDSIILLASNNTTDILDIGIVGHYSNSPNLHAGFVRDSTTKKWHAFDGYGPEPSNNNIDLSVANIATIVANIEANNLIVQGNANITGYTTTTMKSYKEFLVWNTNTATANTIDVSNSNWFRHTLTGNTTFTFANTAANGVAQMITVILIQNGTGGYSPTFSNTIYWAGASMPPATTAANARDVWTFVTIDGGSTFFGTLTIKDAR